MDISWDEKVGYDGQYVDEFNRIGVLADVQILFASVIKVFKKENIYENKPNAALTDVQAAQQEEAEIIRIAHLPDKETI